MRNTTENHYALTSGKLLFFMLKTTLSAAASPFIQNMFCSVLDISPSLYPLSSASNLIDCKLLLITLMTGVFANFIWMFSIRIFNVFITQPMDFMLDSSFLAIENKKLLLQDVIQPSSQIIPIVQYLAFQDFSKLSRNSAEKRKIVFSLSMPGGHPMVWNSLSNACLNFLDTMNKNLSKSQVATSKVNGNKEITGDACYNRFLSNDFINRMIQILKNFVCLVRAKPIIDYLTSKVNRSDAHLCFAQCQPCIWIVDGLSYLVLQSYKEDKYGVVQQQLPRILSSFLTLYQNLEFQQKSGTFIRKTSKEQQLAHIKLALELKQTLNSSIYRITQIFSHDLLDVVVDIDHKLLLRNFLDMKQ
ncbi:Nucleoporin NDC1 [Nymphon striatum]|nr:Nucleoporin NDC1 [Nymphon striatum]